MSSLCRLYADDNSLQHCSTDIHDIESFINNDLCCIDMWSKQQLLKFNPLKTKAILLRSRKILQFPCLKFPRLCFGFCVKALTYYFITRSWLVNIHRFYNSKCLQFFLKSYNSRSAVKQYPYYILLL